MYEHHVKILRMIKDGFSQSGYGSNVNLDFNRLISNFESGDISEEDRKTAIQIYKDGVKSLMQMGMSDKNEIVLLLAILAVELEMEIE